MSTQTPTLQATIRERKGTRYARRLRSEGRIPAVIYGQGTDPMSISLDHIETYRLLKSGNHVFEIEIDGASTKQETCLVKDLQFGWLGDDLIHLDLTRVDLDQKVEVKVRIHFIGEPTHLATISGGVVEQSISELEVTCKVRDIPEEITVKLEQMTGETMTIGDLEMPDGVVPTASAEERVCQIVVADDVDGAAEAPAESAAPADGDATPEEGGGEGDS